MDTATSITVDADGNILRTDTYLGTIDFDDRHLVSAALCDGFLTKLDPFGNHLWSKRFTGKGEICSEDPPIVCPDEFESVSKVNAPMSNNDFGNSRICLPFSWFSHAAGL